jgi:signal transduction histidine kinase/FixJ family two-component response regulator/PAS domain-containing protein
MPDNITINEGDAPFAMEQLLVIDDDENILRLIKAIVQGMELELLTTTDPREGLRLLKKWQPAVVLVDLVMPNQGGLSFIQEGMEVSKESIFLMMTAHVSMESLVEAMKLGIHDYLEKPFQSMGTVQLVINNALSRARLQSQLKYQACMTEAILNLNAAEFSHGTLPEFVGLLVDSIKQVTGAPVLASCAMSEARAEINIDSTIPMSRGAAYQLADRIKETLSKNTEQSDPETVVTVQLHQADASRAKTQLNKLGTVLVGEVHSQNGLLAVILAAHPKRRAFSELSVRMTDALCRHASFISKAKEATQESEQQRIVEHLRMLPDGIILLKPEGDLVDMNAAARRILTLDENSSDQNEFRQKLEKLDPEMRDIIENGLKKDKEGPLLRVLNEDMPSFFQVKSWDVTGPAKKPMRMLVLTNVTAVIEEAERLRPLYEKLERLNKKLTQRNQDLERMNKELDNFAYIASHDLREPFRHIEIFTQFLENDIGKDLNEETGYLFNQIITNARIAERLLTDLRTLSRITRTRNPYSVVDMNILVGEVLGRFEFPMLKDNVSVTTGQLGESICDGTKIKEVFHNLISNAIKYNDKDKPEITITSKETSTELTLKVQDNGIGVSPDYHDYIFQPCRRIPMKHDIEGSGLGLTITRKIIEEHGGKIWIESGLGQGVAMIFTLPNRASSTFEETNPMLQI